MAAEFAEEDMAFIRQFMPEGAVPMTLIGVVAWLDPETAEENWCCAWIGDDHLTRLTGLLELAKVDIMARSSRGEMFMNPREED